jgi:hypothetical protein
MVEDGRAVPRWWDELCCDGGGVVWEVDLAKVGDMGLQWIKSGRWICLAKEVVAVS